MVETLPKEIDRETLRLLVRRGAQLVDVLPREEYEEIHLSGAVSIPMAMISRNTANRLQWDKPVIVYSRDCTCDLSARAAWRLSTLGFTQVFRYTAGREDWLANGMPVEGTGARTRRAGDLADMDVPTCARAEKVGDVRKKVEAEGWDACVVATDQMVVLGLLRRNDLEKAAQTWAAEEAMDRDPQAYRLNDSIQDIADYLDRNRGIDSVLVTTTDGKLFGLVKRQAVEEAE